jgi:hypothetical protein
MTPGTMIALWKCDDIGRWSGFDARERHVALVTLLRHALDDPKPYTWQVSLAGLTVSDSAENLERAKEACERAAKRMIRPDD